MRLKRFFVQIGQSFKGENRTLWLFGVEGLLVQYLMTTNYFGNNLYATNLGATNTQVSLLQMLPQLMTLILLLPLGFLGDRLKSRRTLPIGILCVQAAMYLGLGFAPLMVGPEYQVGIFLVFVMLSAGLMSPYTAAWQAFLSDVTPPEGRNRVIAFRQRCMMGFNLVLPLVIGQALAWAPQAGDKLVVHRIIAIVAAAMALMQAFTLSRIKGGGYAVKEKLASFSLKGIGGVIKQIAHDKRFLGFLVPTLLFYIGWQMDWSLYYLGQRQHLLFTEAQLSYIPAIEALLSVFVLGIWAKLVEKRGLNFMMTVGAFGMGIAPVSLLISAALPPDMRFTAFFSMNIFFCIFYCIPNLCIAQMLLQVVPQVNKSLIIALYTVTIALSNAFSPFLGVQIYSILGSNYSALLISFAIMFVLRVGAGIIYFTRGRRMAKAAKDAPLNA